MKSAGLLHRGLSVFILSWGVIACTEKQKTETATPRTTEELVKSKGEPQFKDKLTTGLQREVWTYPDQKSFQIENQKITYTTRPPTANESSLQYWVQRWDGQDVLTQEVRQADLHVQPVLQFRSLQSNEEILYDSKIDKVTDVVTYEK